MKLLPAHQTFIAECRDLLAAMEDALLQLEHEPDNTEAINAVFRAAHTIKGSAGVFGFDAIVAFTHVMESLLEEIRAGSVVIDGDMIALLLLCADHVSNMIAQTTSEGQIVDAETRVTDVALIARLQVYLDLPAPALPALAEPGVAKVESSGGNVSSDTWHISLRFGRDVLRHGMDPLSIIRYLETLGEMANVATLCDTMPDADNMNPESCYLGLEMDFRGAVDKKTIEGAFDFVRDDCAIRILPPHSKIADYILLINELPEDKSRLGELLITSGALTERELEEGLLMQEETKARGGMTPSVEDPRKIGEILARQGVVQHELVDAALEKQRVVKEHRALENSFMRVRADKLDELITLVGELVIAGAGTRLLAQRAGDSELIESSLTLEGLVEQIRDGALKLRMVPIGDTFNRFNRVVRDLGRDMGKQAELIISGGETELDKSMVDKIGDPLMHLVRNALDHGIESATLRQQRGKAEAGRIYLNAYHDSGSIVIEVADDGGGLDRNKIMAKAIERGLAMPGQLLSDKEIYQLVMEPGFSTAQAVTNVSGRGMGMDVVKRNVEALRGAVIIDSTEGIGTTFSIRLPLTLAIIDGFLVGVGSSSYIVPLDTVVECMELSAQDRLAIRSRSYINLRDEVLPLLRLRDVFEVAGEAGRRENIVVVKYAGQQAGLVVDVLLGEFQTVIKPLGKLFEHLGGISGSTILGSGEVALILDVLALVQKAVGKETLDAAHAATGKQLLPKQIQ